MKIERIAAGNYVANCYLVADEASKEAAIIDPGAGGTQIVKLIQDYGLKLKYIILTHRHPDHIGAVREVKEATGAKLAVHVDDADGLKVRPFGTTAPYSIQPLPKPDQLLKDGDAIEIGSLRLSVIHTPGHTEGGICLLVEGYLFSGDTLFASSVGRWDMPGGDGRQLISAIMTKLMTLPDETVVLPGHGPETTIGNERRGNPFLQGQGIS